MAVNKLPFHFNKPAGDFRGELKNRKQVYLDWEQQQPPYLFIAIWAVGLLNRKRYLAFSLPFSLGPLLVRGIELIKTLAHQV